MSGDGSEVMVLYHPQQTVLWYKHYGLLRYARKGDAMLNVINDGININKPPYFSMLTFCKYARNTIVGKNVSVHHLKTGGYMSTTSKERANPECCATTVNLKGLSIVQVLCLLSELGFTVSAHRTSMWESRPDTRRRESEPEPPVFVIWINDGEASKLTVYQSNGSVKTLSPGIDLHYFVPPESVGGDAEWCAIKSLNVMR